MAPMVARCGIGGNWMGRVVHWLLQAHARNFGVDDSGLYNQVTEVMASMVWRTMWLTVSALVSTGGEHSASHKEVVAVFRRHKY